jgi:hypothetical protein
MGRRERDREEGRREAGRGGREGGREYLGDIASHEMELDS